MRRLEFESRTPRRFGLMPIFSQPQALFASRLPQGAAILDVGCGDFSRIRRYVVRRRRDLRIVGVERFSDGTIYGPLADTAAGTRPYERYACDIETERLPFDDGSFHGAYFSHVIEHLTNKHHALAEIARVLRPDGLLYVETPGPGSARGWRPPWVSPTFGGTIRYEDDPTHVEAPLDQSQLQAMLGAADLRVVRSGVFRELGAAAMPVYAMMAAAGSVPLVPRATGSFLFGAGMRNLLGFGIFAVATKPSR